MEGSHKRSLIILGVLAMILLALFVISVVYRPGDSSPGSGCSPGQRETWRARLLRSEDVAPGQLGGCTAAAGPFTIPGGCELRIAAADARSRRLVIEAVDPVELRRVTSADGRRIAMRADLAPGKSTQIFVGKEGEAVGLRCSAGLTCRARVR
jgi:hypothetical protein